MRAPAALVLLSVLAGPAVSALEPDRALTQYGRDTWRMEDGLPQNSVYAIAQTPDGYLWLGTAEGLARFDGVRFTTYDRRAAPALPSNVVTALTRARAGGLWVGTEAGLARLSDGTLTRVAHATVDGRRINVLQEDRSGALWVGTSAAGLARRDPVSGTWRLFDRAHGFPGDTILGIAQDRDGSLWVATDGAGLVHVSETGGDVLGTLGTAEGLPSMRLRQVVLAPDGTLWIASFEHGVAELRGSKVVARPDLGRPSVQTMYADRHGSIWLSTAGDGLVRVRGRQISRLASPTGDATALLLTAMFEDAEGSLWLGAFGSGLLRLRDGSFVPWTRSEGLLDDSVRGLADAIVGPFRVFFETHGVFAVLMLVAISLYRLPDFLMGPMANPLYHDVGLTKDTVGAVRASVGLIAAFGGIAYGGYFTLRYGYMRGLLVGGMLQAAAVAAFGILAYTGPNVPAFVAVMMADNFCIGFAGVALVSYMSSLTSLGYTATQYALLASTYAWVGKLMKGFSGVIVETLARHVGLMNAYAFFFFGAGAIGIPATLLFVVLDKRQRRALAAPPPAA